MNLNAFLVKKIFKKIIFITLVSLVFFINNSFVDQYGNDITIKPWVSKDVVSLGETFYLKINIHFKSPSKTHWYVDNKFKLLKIEEFLNNFTVISQSIDTTVNQTNDYDIMDLSYTYVLQARSIGDFTLKDIGLMYYVVDNNNTYTLYANMDNNDAITIKVVNTPNTTTPNFPNNPNIPNNPNTPNNPNMPNNPNTPNIPNNPNNPNFPNAPNFPNTPPTTSFPNLQNPFTTNPTPNYQNPFTTTNPTNTPPNNPYLTNTTTNVDESNYVNILLMVLGGLIALVIVILGIYWIYKILSTPPKTETISKEQDNQVLTVDKFEKAKSEVIEKINLVDYSKVNFYSKLDELKRNSQYEKWEDLKNNLSLLIYHLYYKIDSIFNKGNLKESLEILKNINKESYEFISNLYNKVYKFLLYDFDQLDNNHKKEFVNEITKELEKAYKSISDLKVYK
jgi:hypothetical protein